MLNARVGVRSPPSLVLSFVLTQFPRMAGGQWLARLTVSRSGDFFPKEYKVWARSGRAARVQVFSLARLQLGGRTCL